MSISAGAPQTMLATFYAKALDADLEKPILGDRWARDIVDRIDYDWTKTTITARNVAGGDHPVRALRRMGAAVSGRAPRSRSCCTWAVVWTAGTFGWTPARASSGTTSTIPMSPRCVSQLYPEREHYHVVAASVTDPGWLADSARRPADADDRRGPDDVPHRGGRRRAAAPDRRARPVRGVAVRRVQPAGHQSRSGPTRWCGVRGRRCTGASTGPTTSSRRCPACGCWPGYRPSNRIDFARRALVLPRDATA